MKHFIRLETDKKSHLPKMYMENSEENQRSQIFLPWLTDDLKGTLEYINMQEENESLITLECLSTASKYLKKGGCLNPVCNLSFSVICPSHIKPLWRMSWTEWKSLFLYIILECSQHNIRSLGLWVRSICFPQFLLLLFLSITYDS